MKRITLLITIFFIHLSFSQNESVSSESNQPSTAPQTASFTELTTSINNFFFSSMDWGDYDNDGDMDLIISGGLDTSNDTFADTSAIKLYQNTNGVFSEVPTPNIYGLHLGAVKFVDIDNDKDLDLVVTGQNYSDITTYFFTIYENASGTFSAKQQLNGSIYSSIDSGDYDNDGDLDLLVTGVDQSGVSCKIYTNTNGTYANSSITLPGVQNGSAEFGDLDLDGDLDIVLMGYDVNDSYILKTYSNTNGSYAMLQNLPGMYLGWLTLGDYDNDGDLDLAIMGDDTNDDYAARIYNNTNGNFTLSTNSLTGIDSSSGTSSVAWGDYDNDGDLDLIMAGTDENYDDVTFLYENNAGTLTKLTTSGIKNVGGNTSLGWADYDGDLDLDIIVSGFYTNTNSDYVGGTFLHRNDETTTNLKPNMPSNLSTVLNMDNSITFQWDQSSDDHTPANGLYYWITVGTTDGGSEIASYKVQGTSWTIKNLSNINYFWSVQSVDTAFAFSDKASAQTLSLEEFETLLASSISLYPNPSKNNVAIMNTSNQTIESISIYDIQGKELKNISNPTNNPQINISDLSSGMYITKIKIASTILTKKLIVK